MINGSEHRLRVVRDIEDESPEFQAAGKQLAQRKPLVSWWRRLVGWLRSWRHPEYVDTGMGRLTWRVYRDMRTFAERSGNKPLLDALRLK